jgi:hypothetical protein
MFFPAEGSCASTKILGANKMMKVTLEIKGQPILIFSCTEPELAQLNINEHRLAYIRDELTTPLDPETKKSLWDGEAPITFREPTGAELAKWENFVKSEAEETSSPVEVNGAAYLVELSHREAGELLEQRIIRSYEKQLTELSNQAIGMGHQHILVPLLMQEMIQLHFHNPMFDLQDVIHDAIGSLGKWRIVGPGVNEYKLVKKGEEVANGQA